MFRRTIFILSFTSTSNVRSFLRLTPNRHSYSIKKIYFNYISSYLQTPRLFPTSPRRYIHAASDDFQENTCDSFESNLRFSLTQVLKGRPTDIGTILLLTIRILEFYDAPEPLQSACHIIAFTLQENNDIHDTPILWEDNLFANLLQILEPIMETHCDDLTITTNKTSVDLESFLLLLPSTLTSFTTSNTLPILHRKLTTQQMNHLVSMLIRRIKKEPLQYIFEKWDFFDFTLKVRRPCLCPRPETEELVHYVSQDLQRMIVSRRSKGEGVLIHGKEVKQKKIRILDVGSGTGAIGIALARLFPNDVQVVAIDVKKEAVDLSMENAHLLLPKDSITMQHDSLYQAILCSASDYKNTFNPIYNFEFDVIVSNPPYIPLADMTLLTEDVVNYEDADALCGGTDGMDVIRTIIKRLKEWCNDSDPGNESICWMEVDPSQPHKIQQMVSHRESISSHTIRYVESRKDLRGLDRFVKLTIHQVLR